MKKLLLLILCLTLSACTAERKTAINEEPDVNLTAIVTSDLHFTNSRSTSSAVVPLAGYGKEMMETITNEVIAQKPDVFIATGDLTNSGSPGDSAALVPYFQKMKEAGIHIILTVGNHDLNEDDADGFEKAYYPLVTMSSRDSDSLSYASVIFGVRFLAMDDCTGSDGKSGTFSHKTMTWLKQQLQTAEKLKQKVIFLSHHPALETNESSGITNSSLTSLLKRYEVQLCLCGHLHQQEIIEHDGIYEIISAMPMSGSHLIGRLQISGSQLNYRAAPLDFETFGPEGFAETVQEKDDEGVQKLHSTISAILEKEGCSAEEKEKISSLFLRFMQYESSGTIALYADKIRSDPSCGRMLQVLQNYNYGPWMESVLENPPLPAQSLSLTLS